MTLEFTLWFSQASLSLRIIRSAYQRNGLLELNLDRLVLGESPDSSVILVIKKVKKKKKLYR